MALSGSESSFQLLEGSSCKEGFALFCFVRRSHQEQRSGAVRKHILTQPKEELCDGSR